MKKVASFIFLYYALVLAYILAGIVAFFMSIVCFNYKGKASYNIIGFLIALFLGPFYWIYYALNSKYCYNE